MNKLNISKNIKSMNDSDDFLEILRSERRDLINRLRVTQFTTLKKGYAHSQIIPYASYSPWINDKEFIAKFELAHTHTLVDIYRCYELYILAKQSAVLDGEMVEVGVWRGGTAALIASAIPNKKMYLFDTFTGVAKADVMYDTLYSGGEHSDASVENVIELFEKFSLDCYIHTGIFPDDTLGGLPKKISFAHIDVDTYESAKGSFFSIWPRIVKSGIIVFDDYGFFGCEGVSQAVNEIFMTVDDAVMVHNLNGHALIIKK